MIVTSKIDSEQITSEVNDTREFVPREIKKSPLSALTRAVLSGLILEKNILWGFWRDKRNYPFLETFLTTLFLLLKLVTSETKESFAIFVRH